jgi:hypothetical protein
MLTPDKINGTLIRCACWKYYPVILDLTFIRVILIGSCVFPILVVVIYDPHES